MPDSASSTVVILLGTLAGLLVLLTMVVFGIARSLGRIQRSLMDTNLQAPERPPIAPATEVANRRAFETFLEEDPARRKLAKREQFAAYRQWRKEKGLNWENS